MGTGELLKQRKAAMVSAHSHPLTSSDGTLGLQTPFEVQSLRCPPGPAAYVVPTFFVSNRILETHPCDSGLQPRLVKPHKKAASPVPPLDTTPRHSG